MRILEFTPNKNGNERDDITVLQSDPVLLQDKDLLLAISIKHNRTNERWADSACSMSFSSYATFTIMATEDGNPEHLRPLISFEGTPVYCHREYVESGLIVGIADSETGDWGEIAWQLFDNPSVQRHPLEPGWVVYLESFTVEDKELYRKTESFIFKVSCEMIARAMTSIVKPELDDLTHVIYYGNAKTIDCDRGALSLAQYNGVPYFWCVNPLCGSASENFITLVSCFPNGVIKEYGDSIVPRPKKVKPRDIYEDEEEDYWDEEDDSDD